MLVILCPVLIREKVVTNILPIVYLLPIFYGIKSLPVKMFPKTPTKKSFPKLNVTFQGFQTQWQNNNTAFWRGCILNYTWE